MSLVLLFHYLLFNMVRMLVHPSSGACDLLWIYFMCCIALVRCVLVLRCGSAGVVWYPYAGWSTTVWFGWGGVVSLCRLKHYSVVRLGWCGILMQALFVFGSPETSSLEFSCGGTFLPVLWKSVYRFPETHQEVVYRAAVLTSIAYWLHQIEFLPFNLYHRFLQWELSSPRPCPSLGRRPRLLRWWWCVYWIVCIELSAEEHSAKKSSSIVVQLSFSGSIDSRSSCLDWNCMLPSIFVAFEVI